MGWRTATGSGVPDVREKSRILRLRAEAPSQPVFVPRIVRLMKGFGERRKGRGWMVEKRRMRDKGKKEKETTYESNRPRC